MIARGVKPAHVQYWTRARTKQKARRAGLNSRNAPSGDPSYIR
jgi:hypothetical protein